MYRSVPVDVVMTPVLASRSCSDSFVLVGFHEWLRSKPFEPSSQSVCSPTAPGAAPHSRSPLGSAPRCIASVMVSVPSTVMSPVMSDDRTATVGLWPYMWPWWCKRRATRGTASGTHSRVLESVMK